MARTASRAVPCRAECGGRVHFACEGRVFVIQRDPPRAHCGRQDRAKNAAKHALCLAVPCLAVPCRAVPCRVWGRVHFACEGRVFVIQRDPPRAHCGRQDRAKNAAKHALCLAVPCLAVPCRAVPCRAVCGGRVHFACEGRVFVIQRDPPRETNFSLRTQGTLFGMTRRGSLCKIVRNATSNHLPTAMKNMWLD